MLWIWGTSAWSCVETCGVNGTWKGPVASTTWRASIVCRPAFATYIAPVLVNEVMAVFRRTGSLNLAA
jgi:hypothetical protein